MPLPRTPSFRLDGKRALVTGGSRGIGLGCAVALAEAGAHVIVAARNATQVQAAVTEMAQEGMSAEALVLDVTETDAMRDAVAGLAPLDILAQQIVATVATREWGEDELFDLCRRADPYRDLTRQEFEAVIRMLAEGICHRPISRSSTSSPRRSVRCILRGNPPLPRTMRRCIRGSLSPLMYIKE